MAKVVKEFWGAADHDPKTRLFKPGEEVTGDLAAVAVREGWAEPAKAAKGEKAPAPDEPALAEPMKAKAKKA